MYPVSTLISTLSLLAALPTAFAGFNPSSSNNVAVYWGQNSYGASTGTLAQQRLSAYCANTDFNIIPLAFLLSLSNPTLNFANAGNNCTAISGSSLFSCPQLEEDIATCQTTYGKTILLSIGGATYTEGGFSTSAAAVSAATNIWSIFGPVQSGSSSPRPFGTSVVDGFDFDFESTVSNMVPFANQLRSLMTASTASTGKTYYLSAAPQCPYPDAADNDMLNGAVSFDIVWVQFYNNYCGLQSYVAGTTTQNNFNFATWDNWAKTVSLNPNVKVMLGIPASATAAGSGYESGSTLASIITYSKTFSSFGGVMMWDMSQAYANSGFLDAVVADLGGTVGNKPATTLSTLVSRATSVSSKVSSPSTLSTSTKASISTSMSSKISTSSISASSVSASSVSTSFTLSTTNSKISISTITSSSKNSSPSILPTNTSTKSSTPATISNPSTTISTANCPAAPTVTVTVAAVTVTVTASGVGPAPAASTSAAVGTVNQWNQCAGLGWAGGTVCKSPYVCTFLSVWYSQCQ